MTDNRTANTIQLAPRQPRTETTATIDLANLAGVALNGSDDGLLELADVLESAADKLRTFVEARSQARRAFATVDDQVTMALREVTP